MNALRHGLDAAPGVLLPGEDLAEREALASAYRDDLRPGTPEEEHLVAQMAETTWLQRRAEAAAYAAAAEAIAIHGPGTNVLVMEACAGGRGPFFRAEGWSLRLSGRLVRLVGRFTASQRTRARAVGAASRLRGTKPLRPSLPRHVGSVRGAAELRPGSGFAEDGEPGIRTGPGLAPDRCGAGAPAGNKAIARPTGRVPFPLPAATATPGAHRMPQFVTPHAGNKAIAPAGGPGGASAPHSMTRNKAIAPPRAAQAVARAVGSVVAGMAGGRDAIELGYTAGAEQSHCAGRPAPRVVVPCAPG